MGLDGLRAFAAIAVVLYHYTVGYNSLVDQGAHRFLIYFSHGHFGVELFFVISGFVILWTLTRYPDLFRFSAERVARLYPAYLFCVLFTSLVIFAFGFNVDGVTPRDLALNLLIGVPFLIHQRQIDPSYWTLTYEIVFYVLSATVVLGFPRIRVELACIAWMLIGLAARFAIHAHIVQILLISYYSHLFVAGMMVFVLTRRDGPNPLAWLTMGIAVALALLPPEFNGGGMSQAAYLAMIVAFIGLVWLAARGRLRLLSWTPLARIGEASYSLYLVHQIFGYWLITHMRDLGVSVDLAIYGALAVAILVSLAIRRYVEIPGQRAVRRVARIAR